MKQINDSTALLFAAIAAVLAGPSIAGDISQTHTAKLRVASLNGCGGSSGGTLSRGLSNTGQTTKLTKLMRDAEEGGAKAQFELGQLYESGQGVDQNFATAAEWYQKSAAQNNRDAEESLAGLYISGHGVERNFQSALHWLELAAQQGSAKSAYLAGLLYASGDQVPVDMSKATYWWSKAADQGHAGAQRNLGVAYLNGDGQAQNYVEAYKWLSLAEKNGDASAGEPRKQAAAKLSADQISSLAH